MGDHHIDEELHYIYDDDDEDDGVFFPASEDEDRDDENMPISTGMTAMIQDDDVNNSGERAAFLPFQQINPGEFPCSEEIIFHDLEKVVKSSAAVLTTTKKHTTATSHRYMQEEMQTKEILFHKDEVEHDPDQTGPEFKLQKRKRSSEAHNLNERLRRQKLQEKMKALQQLIPNCDKREKGHVLDEAMKYIKTLQSQVQEYHMMSSIIGGAGFSTFNSPLYMMPTQSGTMQIPTLPQFPPITDHDPLIGIGHGNGNETGMGMEITINQLGFPIPISVHQSAVSGMCGSSSSSAHSIQNYPKMPPSMHGTNVVSQCTSIPSRGTTTTRVLPSQHITRAHVVNEYRSSHSGSSERDTSSSIAKFQRYH